MSWAAVADVDICLGLAVNAKLPGLTANFEGFTCAEVKASMGTKKRDPESGEKVTPPTDGAIPADFDWR